MILGADLDNTVSSNMLAAPVQASGLGAFARLNSMCDFGCRRYAAAVAVVNDRCLLRKPSYSQFCPKFRCHGNQGGSGVEQHH